MPINTPKQRLTPLMLISVFFAFTEVVLGVGVIKTTGPIQVTLTVFAVLFPSAIAAAFFRFLWKRPTHLYAPGEYSSGRQFTDAVEAPAGSRLRYEIDEITAIAADKTPDLLPTTNHKQRDVLMVIDVQNDFIDGVLAVAGAESLIPALNDAIIAAHRAGFIIVFTRDWHPTNHSSFKVCDGPHDSHCVAGSPGAELHPHLFTLVDHVIVDFGTSANARGYSPLENLTLRTLMNSESISRVFVTGIAFEYCVQACCLDLRRLGRQVVAVEPLIVKTDPNPSVAQRVWNTLEADGVTRSADIPRELQRKADAS